jgi:hypothetical protein
MKTISFIPLPFPKNGNGGGVPLCGTEGAGAHNNKSPASAGLLTFIYGSGLEIF